MNIRKLSALVLVAVMLLSFAACTGANTADNTTEPVTQRELVKGTQVNIAMLKGPTGIGAAKLMSDLDSSKTDNKYQFTLSTDPTEITSGIISGSFDIAACPLNLASVLYNKTEGKVQILAVNTLGTLYILSNDASVTSIADLAGKTVVAAGQGATPEYVLNYLLEKNGIADKVTVEYKSEHSEVATLAASGSASIVLLPEPNVTSVLLQNNSFSVAVDLSKEFEKASGVSLAMGCVIARKDFVENNPDAIEIFMSEYKASIDYAASNLEDTAALCETYGIIPKAAVAKKAIPNCNITFVSGEEMKKVVTENLTVLAAANPASVGGKLPADDFWYGIK